MGSNQTALTVACSLFDIGASLPTPPAYTFEAAPIYIDPMPGSGERIAVIAVVIGQHGIAVTPLIRREVIEYLYANKAAQFSGLIDLLVSSLSDHLAQGASLCQWSPPLETATLGDVRNIMADSAEHATVTIARLHASLALLPALGAPNNY